MDELQRRYHADPLFRQGVMIAVSWKVAEQFPELVEYIAAECPEPDSEPMKKKWWRM